MRSMRPTRYWGTQKKSARYDQLIFRDSFRRDFDNKEAFEYWKDRKPAGSGGRMRDPLKEEQERVRDRLKNYKDCEDFLGRYEHHR